MPPDVHTHIRCFVIYFEIIYKKYFEIFDLGLPDSLHAELL